MTLATRWPAALLAVALATGCTADPEPTADAGPTTDPSSASATPEPTPEPPGPAERLGVTDGWGPSRDALDRAARRTGRMSLPELAGQVIVAAYAGTAAPVGLVTDLHLGGVIAFSDNIVSAAQIREANATLRRAAGRPLLIGVDQEGGIVARASEGVAALPAFMSAGAARSPEVTRAAMHGLGADLADLGFTADFAPVADVTTGPDDPTIGSRSPGSEPDLVSEQMHAAVDGFLDAGVVPVVKHFPGHGSVPADSHETLPVQTRSRVELDAADLIPFARAASEGRVPAVMVGHIDVPALDPGTPSSLSERLVTGVLREELGFAGLVVTDALDMAGVADGRTSAETAVAALQAGADVLLMPPDPRAARDGIVAAVRAGDLDRRRLRQAATRQVALLLDRPATGERPDSAAASAALSAAAITVVAGPCAGRLVGETVRPTGSAETVAAFTAAARRAGLATGAGTTVAFTGFRGPAITDVGDGGVVVATDTPYVLGRSNAPIKIATYGVTPGAMDALVAVLLGEAPAPGRLPVSVPDVPRQGC